MSESTSTFVNILINDTTNTIIQTGDSSSQLGSIQDNMQWVETGQVSHELELSAAVQNAGEKVTNNADASKQQI